MPKIDGGFEINHRVLMVALARLIAQIILCLMSFLAMLFFNYITNL
jgi:hypothetical protein